MRVVLTEKPSVARDLAEVLGLRQGRAFHEGDGLRITWAVGHLVELEEPRHYDAAWKSWSFDHLPMVPETFALRVRKDADERFEHVVRLLRDSTVTEVINACDAGREGELIFRYIYELAGCTAPVKRLWLASLTESAIRDAWARLRPGQELDPLADAARCRSEADWLVGLNATRGMTCLARLGGGGRVLSVGRVQTPTLAMIVGRDAEIAAFVPETTFQVRADFEAAVDDGVGRWQGTFFRPADAQGEKPEGAAGPKDDEDAPSAERLPSRDVAQALVAAVVGRQGEVETSETKRFVDKAPLLYDLTSLQRRANQRYGLSAQRTLEIAQALYERHKLITYPRTDSRHLTPDQLPELPGLARGLAEMDVYRPHAQAVIDRLADGFVPGRRVIDASEVGDHHAILPTGRAAHRAGLNPDEKRVFDLVARRFLAALSPDALFDRTTLIVAVHQADPVPGIDAPPRFRSRGRVCVQEGWRAVDPPGRSKEIDLPRVPAGGLARVVDSTLHEGQTRPPRPYNDASILKDMETAGRKLDDAALQRAMRGSGLGTPATRAAILQTLLDRGFVARRQRDLVSTERGQALIAAIPAPELKSAELTARWESRLERMASGREDRGAFMDDVAAHVAELVQAMRVAEPPTSPAFAAPPGDDQPVGTCPRCQGTVVERRPVFDCGGCTLVVFKKMAGREVSRRMVQELLRDGRTKPVKGFRSKAGKSFSAGLELREDGSVGFWFPVEAEVGRCPRCDTAVRRRGKVWSCETQECGFVVFAEMSGKALDDDIVRALLSDGRTALLDGFVSKRTGKAFSAALKLDEAGKAGFDFDDGPKAPVVSGPAPHVDEGGQDPAGMTCPGCGEGRLLRGRTAWGCSRYREGCRWMLRFDAVGSAAEAVATVQASLSSR